jgi:hypothetical protein
LFLDFDWKRTLNRQDLDGTESSIMISRPAFGLLKGIGDQPEGSKNPKVLPGKAQAPEVSSEEHAKARARSLSAEITQLVTARAIRSSTPMRSWSRRTCVACEPKSLAGTRGTRFCSFMTR